MKAVILAAGYATRLYPLTEHQPKCLLKVGNKTILDRLTEQLDRIPELEELVIVTNARFFDVLSNWAKGAKLRAPIRMINDKTTSNDNRLGATGDLALALKEADIRTDILLLASDNLFEQSIKDFTDYAQTKRGAVVIGVFDLGAPEKAAKTYGVIEVKADGEVAGFEEKPEKPKSSLIGMGVYFFPAAILPKVGEYLKDPKAQDAPGFFVSWLQGKVKIFSFQFRGLWYDIGDLKSLEEANRIFLENKR